ncbi:hypothetical protein COCCADRAFT_38427 [Bipolaris zeicola 26-R-13]|uniref:SPX domain-containing protein n=1 Tax=Cochliobolus carbonum (strain 26-R-13) TaxID=930089 RepID=W6Y1L7_COCC2|nr:uncharacterized protein COCCADRAFT_38427 [Bipolaris zeicola 26-R-13]EUC31490.1 hypothetical protein COCCADRAFT_38427 [Bipolaris zeicola 26-R-13]
MGNEIPIPAGLIEEPLDHAVDIIGEMFKDDPFQRYVLMGELAKRGETDVSYEHNREIFADVIPGILAGEARAITVAGSGISSVWRLEPIEDEPIIPPHYPPGVTELNLAAHKTKKQHLPPTATHMLHLSLLGNYREHPSNDKSCNHKVSEVMRPVLKMAKEKGWPVVLEATSENVRAIVCLLRRYTSVLQYPVPLNAHDLHPYALLVGMKYGDTLRQRSIPEWGHYNIDYDYLKELIKHQTTPGTNKAVSIPGQGESTERAFGDTFFKVLAEQHDRINLFIRSKSGEIERRLEHISKTLHHLRTKRDPASGRLPARTVERYAKIEADVLRTGEEIRSLSRFQVTQRTGFVKILKKYKRWTKDGELAYVFKQEISSRPDSLFQLDLGYLLDQFVDALDTLRSAFDVEGTSAANATSVTGQSPAARISRSLERGDDVDFDLALDTVSLGSKGSKATYWIHPDHIVEAQVLLLQHMRLYINKARRNSSSRPTPLRRHSSTANMDPYVGSEDTTGLVVLDHPETFAFKQNAGTIGAAEEMQGSIGIKAAGQVRCCASSQAAVIVCDEGDAQHAPPSSVKTVKMERRYLKNFLDTSVTNDSIKHSCSPRENVLTVRQWLAEHTSAKPIAGALLKRTRFTGLHNNSAGGTWATLDKDISLTDQLFEDLGSDDWTSAAKSESTQRFPHAILEIRREGNQATSLIQMLDRSHLVERVRGFSLEAHAVWACCKPGAMSAPFWISLLDKDIRKLPEPVQRRSRKARGSASASVSQMSPTATSTSNTSFDGQSSPLASRYEESSATSVHEFVDPPPLQAFRKKSRKPYSDYPPPIIRGESEAEAQPRYWNEYDHPEDEEGGYYIYIDPDASVKFPGQEFFEACARKTRKLFGIQEEPEEASLSGIEDSDDDNDTIDSSPVIHAANYGAIDSSRQGTEGKGYFSTLFRSLRNPHRDADIFNERRALLGEVESNQHKVEMTKLRFYSTALGAAVVLDLVLCLMTVTSRKKERGVVDAGVMIGTICSLVLCVVAVISMQTRRERLGWVHQGAVLSITGAVVALDIVLLLWVARI